MNLKYHQIIHFFVYLRSFECPLNINEEIVIILNRNCSHDSRLLYYVINLISRARTKDLEDIQIEKRAPIFYLRYKNEQLKDKKYLGIKIPFLDIF